ncbi:DNA sulfur modification protein DndD [uncultured Alteromonas sp.]|jgi:DNA sulfur modification protein DndD|uniref:DNA sulfur modification protein DndD n=1 Tax=uncultured Alteromonas sp. TaxID=179113 RepID=UPI0025898A05|nr:DNA sulfur modification protein DndD [uncultured Alteromonas sp.]
MIFKRLILENFRVFNGFEKIDLSPRKAGVFHQPVILFGGLNGAGKTSILTAIRLALLGKRAVSDAISKKDYQAFLAEQINRTALTTDESAFAKVTLVFTYTHQGEHKQYEISRIWQKNSDEQLTLIVNGIPDNTLTTDQVQSFLNEIVPPGIGDLFFFDGEKIADLAEDDTGTYLKEAVQRLLGIDILNRLSNDLEIYLKDKGSKAADKDTLNKIKAVEIEKLAATNESKKFQENAEQLCARLAELKRDIAKKELIVHENDGAWASNRASANAKLEELVKKKQDLQAELKSEVNGTYPLALAWKSMQALLNQLKSDQKIKQARAFSNELIDHLDGLRKHLSANLEKHGDEAYNEMQRYFGQIINKTAMQMPQLDITDGDFALLEAQTTDARIAKSNVDRLNEELVKVQTELDLLSIRIERAPDAEALNKLYQNLRELEQERDALSRKYINLMLNAKTHKQIELDCAKRLEKLYAALKNKHSADKATLRVEQSQNALAEFKEKLIRLRVTQLEQLFIDAYRKLARKEDLKFSAKIDVKTFDVNLVDSAGVTINRKSLSAGEKQIFAFAILEALGKLSGRVLPVVVDTPLGRLDSIHRKKLVRNYFPEASEQVILLSTDTEVDEDFYQALAPKISHAFEIEFDQQTRSSTVKEGYFWQDKIQEAV